DAGNSNATQVTYYASDTAGVLYRFTMSRLASDVPTPALSDHLPRNIRIRSIAPNPFQATTSIELELRSRQNVTVELFSGSGKRIAGIFSGEVDPGAHTMVLNADGLPSGIYYVAISS